jgi:transposase
MNLSIFDKNDHNDDVGAVDIFSAVLLKIITYCYPKDISSSRKMEEVYKNVIVVKALADEMEPDYNTIAFFVSSNTKAINRVAVEAVLKCVQFISESETEALPEMLDKLNHTMKEFTCKEEPLRKFL